MQGLVGGFTGILVYRKFNPRLFLCQRLLTWLPKGVLLVPFLPSKSVIWCAGDQGCCRGSRVSVRASSGLQVMRDAAEGHVVSWLRALEEESSITPLWEVMFQLMCHPVPQVCSVVTHHTTTEISTRTTMVLQQQLG